MLKTIKTDLAEAFTHRSYLNEDPKVKESNERLEFLGDSVLSLLTSTELFKRFPDFPEGKLTNLRSILVRTQTLAKISKDLGFGQKILMSKGEEHGGGRENPSILADTFEAVLGAIYLNEGLETVRNFLEENLFSKMDNFLNDEKTFDYKSHLQEVIQEKNRVAPTYKTIKESGPDHNKIFVIGVFAASKKLCEGSGKSKQEAEQNAARIALDALKL